MNCTCQPEERSQDIEDEHSPSIENNVIQSLKTDDSEFSEFHPFRREKHLLTNMGPRTRSQLSYTEPLSNSDSFIPSMEDEDSDMNKEKLSPTFLSSRMVVPINPQFSSRPLCGFETTESVIDLKSRNSPKSKNQTENIKNSSFTLGSREPYDSLSLKSLLNMKLPDNYLLDYELYKKLASEKVDSKPPSNDHKPLRSILSKRTDSSKSPKPKKHEFQKPKVRFSANVLLFSYPRDN